MNPEIRIPRRRFLALAATGAVVSLSGIKPADASPLPPVDQQVRSTIKPAKNKPGDPTDAGLEAVAAGFHPDENRTAAFIPTDRRVAAYRAIDRLQTNAKDLEAMRALGIFNGVPDEILEQAHTHAEQHPHMKNTWSETFLIPRGTVARLTTISGVQEVPLSQGLKAAVFLFEGGNLVPEPGAKEKKIEGTTALHFKKAADQLSGDEVGLDLGYDLQPQIPAEYSAHIAQPLPPLVRFVAKHVGREEGSRTRTESLVRRDFDPTQPSIIVMQSISGFDNMLESWALFNGDRGVRTDEPFPTLAKIQG